MKIVLLPFPSSWKTIGVTIYPFIFLSRSVYQRMSPYRQLVLINHESIHIQQQKEWLFLPFFVVYLFHFLYNYFIKGMDYNTAYINICFEKEAYSHQYDLNYLKHRKFQFFSIKKVNSNQKHIIYL